MSFESAEEREFWSEGIDVNRFLELGGVALSETDAQDAASPDQELPEISDNIELGEN